MRRSPPLFYTLHPGRSHLTATTVRKSPRYLEFLADRRLTQNGGSTFVLNWYDRSPPRTTTPSRPSHRDTETHRTSDSTLTPRTTDHTQSAGVWRIIDQCTMECAVLPPYPELEPRRQPTTDFGRPYISLALPTVDVADAVLDGAHEPRCRNRGLGACRCHFAQFSKAKMAAASPARCGVHLRAV